MCLKMQPAGSPPNETAAPLDATPAFVASARYHVFDTVTDIIRPWAFFVTSYAAGAPPPPLLIRYEKAGLVSRRFCTTS
jgi:hypothetical protein